MWRPLRGCEVSLWEALGTSSGSCSVGEGAENPDHGAGPEQAPHMATEELSPLSPAPAGLGGLRKQDPVPSLPGLPSTPRASR